MVKKKPYLRYEYGREIIDNVEQRLGITLAKKVRELAERYRPK